MLKRTKLTTACFYLTNKADGEKLKTFFAKHTGKVVDFNSIKHYNKHTDMLRFSLPLNDYCIANITVAALTSKSNIHFSKADDFIEWYEKSVFAKPITVEQILKASIFPFADPKVESERLFIKQFNEFNLDIDVKFDPFPFFRTFETIPSPSKDEVMVITVLYNGLTARVSLKDCRKTILLMNTNAFYASKKKNWEDFLYYLDIGVIDGGKNVYRFTPTNERIAYAEEDDEDVQIIMNHYNALLNKDHPFEYPKNWFDVARCLMKCRDGGVYYAAYMFAAPRDYLKYFVDGQTDEEIAREIINDNC